MNGLLVRVGIDATDGRWNAPVRTATREFVYANIMDTKPHHQGYERRYDEYCQPLSRFDLELPQHLTGRVTHLDPDFEHLTYGDQGQRGRRIVEHLLPGDLLVFFAALCPVDTPARPLVYAVIGLFVIDEIVRAKDVPQSRWHENAHTRRSVVNDDIVVRARQPSSGRLRRCLPFGEYRNGAYRVRRELLDAWGGLNVRDGYVQRSARLPEFLDAQRFYDWFQSQRPELVAANNPQ